VDAVVLDGAFGCGALVLLLGMLVVDGPAVWPLAGVVGVSELGAKLAGIVESSAVGGAGLDVEGGERIPTTQAWFSRSHTAALLQQTATTMPPQHVVPEGQHTPMPVVRPRVLQHVEPASQQNA
jgi:hypothetical protein